jgi:nucleoside-triphosphatase THEP1
MVGNPVVVVTGGHDAGKSLFCMRVVRAAQRRGLSVGGLITHKLVVDDAEIRFVEDVARREYRLLYRCRTDAGLLARNPSAETIGWAEDVLERAAECDLLVLDELGPHELVSGDGWEGALALLERRAERPTLVVVGDGLLGRFRAALPRRDTSLVALSDENREESLAAMLAWLSGYSTNGRRSVSAAI